MDLLHFLKPLRYAKIAYNESKKWNTLLFAFYLLNEVLQISWMSTPQAKGECPGNEVDRWAHFKAKYTGDSVK